MSWLTDLQAYLIDQEVGTSSNLFRERMPAAPYECMCLGAYGGSRPQRNAEGGMIKRPRLQVSARGTDADAARAWLLQAEQELVPLVNTVVGSTMIMNIEPLQSEPMPLGWDPNKCITLVQNYEVTTR